MNSPLIVLLYALASTLLASGSLYILWRQRNSPAARWFAATGAALLGWTITLFVLQRTDDPAHALWIGRANFAAASLAVYAVYRLVRAVAGLKPRQTESTLGWASVVIALISALTPLVDRSELPASHTTLYGPLLPLYVLHIALMLLCALWTAYRFRSRQTAAEHHTRDQLLLLGLGILATGAVSLATNIVLPYSFGDFRYIDLGPLSTLLLLLCVAYAIVRHQLFDIRVFIRRAVVLGIALSLVLAVYSALVLLATDRFASSESGGVTRFGVLVLAFSFDPVRRFLEKQIDRLLFARGTGPSARR